MALSWAFFALAITWFLGTANALRPSRIPMSEVGTFFAGWFVSELPLVHLVLQAAATALFAWGGALGHWPGLVAIGLAAASWVGLVALEASSLRSWGHIVAALSSLPGGCPEPPPRVRWAERRIPVPRRPAEVVAERNVDYWGDGIPPHRLDVIRPRQATSGAPMMLYIHGGAWILGDKREQGRPMLYHLAREGWVCATINYRLSPRADWPDAVVDCKKAIAWFKEHAADFGGDPARLVVSGGSAGGHLAALVALTSDDTSLQPDFESADTSVLACVPIYGVYDFTNDGHVFSTSFLRFLERAVVKAKIAERRELFEKASPYWRIHPSAPPFLIIAGRNDTLVPVREPRRFVEKMKSISRQQVTYIELPFAQHAFEIFPSVRCAYTIRTIEIFLSAIEGRTGAPAQEAAAAD